jgi:hypothetical protein
LKLQQLAISSLSKVVGILNLWGRVRICVRKVTSKNKSFSNEGAIDRLDFNKNARVVRTPRIVAIILLIKQLLILSSE